MELKRWNSGLKSHTSAGDHATRFFIPWLLASRELESRSNSKQMLYAFKIRGQHMTAGGRNGTESLA